MKNKLILAIGIGLALFASCSDPNEPVKRESPNVTINATDSTVIQMDAPTYQSQPISYQQGYSSGYSGFSPIINYGGGGYYPNQGYGYGGGYGPSMGYNGSQTHIHIPSRSSGFSNGISSSGSSGATPRISQPIVNNVSSTSPPQVVKPHKSFNISTAKVPYAPKYTAPASTYRPVQRYNAPPKSTYKSVPSYSRPSYSPSRSSPSRSSSRRRK